MSKTRSVYKSNILKFNKYIKGVCDKCKEIECICKEKEIKKVKDGIV